MFSVVTTDYFNRTEPSRTDIDFFDPKQSGLHNITQYYTILQNITQ